MKLTHKYLLANLRYDPETGDWTWLVARSNIKVGDKAGSLGPKGYYQVKIKLVSYRAHRLAWFYMTGKWPVNEIDHENRIRNDNRWKNLREATPLTNARNRMATGRSGIRGVRVYKNKFVADVVDSDGTRIYLGIYDTKEQAKSAHDDALQRLFGLPDYSRASAYIQGALL